MELLFFSTNTAGIYIFGSMSNSFGGGQFWTGISTTTNWKPSTGANHCSFWGSNSGALNGNIGDGTVTSYSAIASGAALCNTLKSILCAEL